MTQKDSFFSVNFRVCALLASVLIAGCFNAKAQIATSNDSAPPQQQRATERSKYVIAARAGVINYVSGAAKWQKHDSDVLQALTSKDELETGDRIETGADGFVEMLLSPGAYLRVGANSQVELTNAALDDLRVSIKRGSAILEASGFGGADVAVVLNTPQKPVFITENGLYRVNVMPGETQVLVYKGEARVGSALNGTLVKKKKMLRLRGSDAAATEELASFNTKSQDEIDILSKERAKVLAEMNGQLVSANGSSFSNAVVNYMGLNPYWRSFYGLWAYNPFYSCYTFLPFDNFYSPYGFYYPSFVYIPVYYYRYPKAGTPVPIPRRPIHTFSDSSSAHVMRATPNGNAAYNARSHAEHTMPHHMMMPERSQTMSSAPMRASSPASPAHSMPSSPALSRSGRP
jgi:hypothetical protein